MRPSGRILFFCYNQKKGDNMKGKLFIISGSSGVGKGTVIKELLKRADNLFLSVSSTTRKPREGEVHGKNYYFLSKEEFEEAVKNNEFLEWAEFSTNKYGTSKKTVEEQLNKGQNVLLEIEVQGAMQVKKKIPEAVLIFILPPDRDELEKRLRGRGTESEEAILKRLNTIEFEMKESEKYDYKVVNDTVERAVGEILTIYESCKNV